MFSCELCKKSFTRKDSLLRHTKCCLSSASSSHKRISTDLPSTSTQMIKIKKIVSMKITMVKAEEEKIHCDICNIYLDKNRYSGDLKSTEHKNKMCEDLGNNIEKIGSAFKSRIVCFQVKATKDEPNIEGFFKEKESDVVKLLQKQLDILTRYKLNIELFAIYIFKKCADNLIKEIKSFNSKYKIITQSTDLRNIYKSFHDEIIKKTEEFQERDSGWALQKLCFLELNINKYNPLKASSYIELSAKIKSTKAVINIQNNDEMCFAWAVVAFLYPARNNPHRTSSYPHYSEVLILDGIHFPLKIKDIKLFEKLNNLSINVYGVENNNMIVGPLHYTNSKKEKHINLLYLENGEKSHYCLIKNFSRLISSRLSKNKKSKWVCDGCLLYFESEKKLKEHELNQCNKTRTFLPNETNNILRFNSIGKQLRVPFVIYADFESILKPINICRPSDEISFTQGIHMHEPYSFAYYIKCSFDNSLNHFEIYRGEECIKTFMDRIKAHAKNIFYILNQSIPMKSLTDLERNYELAETCHICKKG